MNTDQADTFIATGIAAYDRGWKDCLDAMIPLVASLPAVDAVLVMRALHDRPPSADAPDISLAAAEHQAIAFRALLDHLGRSDEP